MILNDRGSDGFLAALPMVETPFDIWDKAAETRYELARKGTTASLVDVMIAVIAKSAKAHLLTLDRDFILIAKTAGIELVTSA